MRAPLLPLLSTLLIASGCLSSPTPLTQELSAAPLLATDPQTGEQLFLKPNLTAGRWWDAQLVVDYDDGFVVEVAGTIVVTPDGTHRFRLGADNVDFGALDAYFDSFYVGSLDADLNPIIGGERVQFFQWPLKAGQSWTTRLPGQGFDAFGGRVDDVAFNVTAFEEDTTPEAPRLRVQGLTSHGERLDFDYSARTGWLTYFRMINATTGRVIVSVDFNEGGPAYRGTVHHLTRSVLAERIVVTPPFDSAWAPLPPSVPVTVAEGFDFVDEIKVLFTFPVVAAGGGEVVTAVTLPNGTLHPYAHTGAGDLAQGSFDRKVNRGQLAGTWTVTILPGGTGGAFVGLYGFKDDRLELG